MPTRRPLAGLRQQRRCTITTTLDTLIDQTAKDIIRVIILSILDAIFDTLIDQTGKDIIKLIILSILDSDSLAIQAWRAPRSTSMRTSR